MSFATVAAPKWHFHGQRGKPHLTCEQQPTFWFFTGEENRAMVEKYFLPI